MAPEKEERMATKQVRMGLFFLIIGFALLFAAVLLLGLGPTGFAILSGNIPLLEPSSLGFDGQMRSQNYYALMDALYANGNVTTTIGDKLWVPWYSRSDQCSVNDLHSGSNCNSGETIDATHNCMVTDEFSQVGILVAMGDDQTRMNQFYNTVLAINSTYGDIPAWRVYRSGDTIEQCRSGINGNCDTASDATARIIIALFTASNNPSFANDEQKTDYATLATNLSAAFLQYEVLQSCKESSLGYGDICYWLAAGSGAKSGGFASTDFAYTGYYPDAIIGMLAACAGTEDPLYCAVAGNFTLNYLQAAYPEGTSLVGNGFRVPPGRSYKWTNTAGIPVAECTNTCSPDQWDAADAPRALGLCSANYYARLINYTLPDLQAYCDVWGLQYMNATNSAPYQYYADGTNSGSFQSGYFAQGLSALFQAGGYDQNLFTATVDDALSHYAPATGTWDYQACFGIYMQAFAVRALGMGLGLDYAAFSPLSSQNVSGNETNETSETNQTFQNMSFASVTPISNINIAGANMTAANITEPENITFSYSLDNPDNLTTSTTWLYNGSNQTGVFNQNYSVFASNDSLVGSWNITVFVVSPQNSISHTFLLTVFVTNSSDDINLSENESGNVTGNESNNNTENNTIQNATLIISSSPSGATIRIDDAVIGMTPLTLELEPDTYLVGLTLSDYDTNIQTVDLSEGENLSLNILLTQTVVAAPSGGGGGGGARPIPAQEEIIETDNSTTPVETTTATNTATVQNTLGSVTGTAESLPTITMPTTEAPAATINYAFPTLLIGGFVFILAGILLLAFSRK